MAVPRFGRFSFFSVSTKCLISLSCPCTSKYVVPFQNGLLLFLIRFQHHPWLVSMAVQKPEKEVNSSLLCENFPKHEEVFFLQLVHYYAYSEFITISVAKLFSGFSSLWWLLVRSRCIGPGVNKKPQKFIFEYGVFHKNPYLHTKNSIPAFLKPQKCIPGAQFFHI